MSLKEWVITWDFDGVISRTVKPALDDTNRYLLERGIITRPLREGDWDTWFWMKERVTELTGDPEEGERMGRLFFKNEVLLRAPSYPGAVLGLKALRTLGFNQIVVTSRPPENTMVTKLWLVRRGLKWLTTPEALMMRDGEEIGGVEFKRQTVVNLSPIRHYDDDPILAAEINGAMRLVDRPWNEERIDLDSIRVRGWTGILTDAIRARFAKI